MPRDIPVGNQRLLVNFDAAYQMPDIYFPHVGQENHSASHPFRMGVWCEGVFSWVHDDQSEKSLRYLDESGLPPERCPACSPSRFIPTRTSPSVSPRSRGATRLLS